jgi:putative transposase
MEVDFLKKSLLVSCKDRYVIIEKSMELSVRSRCSFLGLSRSKLFYTPRSETKFNQYLMRIIDEQYLRPSFYGVPRMTRFIKMHYGYTVNY